MSKFQPFGATNQPLTCLWCGRKLRPYRYRDLPWANGREWGGYGDAMFCGLACGYKFAVRMGDLGKRLQPYAIAEAVAKGLTNDNR